MAANQPTTGREILPAGIDVRKIRKPINEAFAAVPVELIGQGAATSKDGRRLSFSVVGEDTFYIRLNTKTTVNGTIRYGWTAVNQDRDSGNWTNCVRAGNSTTDDWATELNNTDLTVGTATRYIARVNPQTGRVTFFFRNRGNVPPVDPCVDGICTSPPSSVVITFPPISEFPPIDYPGSYPYYHLSPGFQCYYNIPGDPRDGALRYESVNGWTYHYLFMFKKMYEILSSTVTVPTLLDNWLETEIDVTSEFADIFPMFGDYKLYEGPTLALDTTTPQKNYEGTFDTELISAKRFVSVRMTHGGACTMRIEAKERIELVTSTSFSETEYQFGPFGQPIGSTTQSGSGLLGAAVWSRRNGFCRDQTGPLFGADSFTYYDASPHNETFSQAVPQTEDGYVKFIDCGDSDVDYNPIFDVLYDLGEGLEDTFDDRAPISYIVQDNDQ